MTRKTLTFSRDDYLNLREYKLAPAEECLIYRLIFDEFLLGKDADKKQLPEQIHIIYTNLKLLLKKMNSQFNNGSKNKPTKITASLCPFDDTQNKPNTATATHAHTYNNIPNLNNNYNNKYISNNQLTNNKYAQPCGEIEKNNNVTAENEPLSDEVQFYLDQVTERAEPLMQTEPKAANKLIEVAKYVTRVKNIKIQGQWMTAAEVLCKYVNIFRTPEPASKIASDLSIFFDSVASNIAKHEVKNSSAYLAAALYLKASGLTA